MAKGRRPNRTGRNKGQFLALPHSVLESREFLGLSSAAKIMVIAVAKLFNGQNNGRLAFSERAAAHWGLSQKTAHRALREAVESGILIKTRDASFTTKTRLATEYGISWRPLAEGIAPVSQKTTEVKTPSDGGKNYLCDGRKTEIGQRTEVIFTSVSPVFASARR